MIPTSLNPLGTRGKTFVTSWNVSAGETIYLPLIADGTYNMVVDWGDGSKSTITSYTQNTHTYSSAGTYTVKINGLCTLWKFKDVTASREKIRSVIQWGDIGLTSMHGAFYRCYWLLSIAPYAPDVADYWESFYFCVRLGNIPEKLLYLASSLTEIGFAFYYCSSLVTIPSRLFIKCKDLYSIYGIFYDCTNLNSIPENLLANNPDINIIVYAFRNTGIITIPENLFANNPNISSFTHTFYNCVALTGIPAGLFNGITAISSFNSTFYNCSNIQGNVPELWVLYPSATPTDCFEGCTNASNYASIPTEWK